MATQGDVTELAAQLEAVIEAVTSGELAAEADQVAWLRGVLVGLRGAASTDRPA